MNRRAEPIIVKHPHFPLIIAHRGASTLAPENTLAAFQRAMDAGVDGIEFDVRLTKDGVPVVYHDSSLQRIAGTKGRVIQYTSSELSGFDVGSWFNRKRPEAADPEFARLRIPTLRETLRSLESFDGLVYIELKCREEDVERLARAVCGEIRESPLLARIVVKSFKLTAIPHVRAMLTDVRTAALFAPKVRSLLRKSKHILDLTEEVGADEISVHYTLATRKVAEEAARRGVDLVIWTADRASWVKRAAELGVKAIITNEPVRLIAKRQEVFGSGPARDR